MSKFPAYVYINVHMYETRKHSSRMRTALDRDPPKEIPLDRDTPLDRDNPWTETPPVNRITDGCKNITFPQLRLQAVMTNSSVSLL